ncbi:MAG: hypothetical protein FGM39_10590 [Phycisphaerales bacterium]|nr:hypothetical protein [Phycisphaerales bacterium]
MKRSILFVGSALALALVAAPAVASFVPPPGNGSGGAPGSKQPPKKEEPKKEDPKKEDPKKEEPKKPS